MHSAMATFKPSDIPGRAPVGFGLSVGMALLGGVLLSSGSVGPSHAEEKQISAPD